MLRFPASYLTAAAPAAIVLALIGVVFQAGPRQFKPWWNDEIIYWNEIASIGRVGLHSGYITVHEQPAPASFLRSGPHGPVFPLLYGSVARVTGWRPYSAFVVNLVLVTLSALTWLAARGPRAGWVDALILGTFWPLLLYLPTNMQEPLHFTFTLLLAAATLRLAERRRVASTWAWTAAIIAIAALSRPTWALMLLPIGWSFARESKLRLAVLVVATTAATLIAYTMLTYMSAPFPNVQGEIIAEARHSLRPALEIVASRTRENIRLFSDPSNGFAPEVVLRYAIVAMTAVLAVMLVRRWRTGQSTRDDVLLEAATLGLLAPLPLVISVGWIEAWRDFRLLAPHLLYALLLAAPLARPVRLVWYGTLALVPLFAPAFVWFHHDRFTTDRTKIAEMHETIRTVMPYASTGDGWANTVLMNENVLQYPLLGLPPGIGTSFVLDWSELRLPPRSRYLLLRPQDEATLRGKVAMTPLAVTPLGTLYRNAESP